MNRDKAILLNASNMESYPVYPYTFIQVPAIARRAGVEVTCKDLLGIPRECRGESIRNLIERHEPSMILITLRNTDSMVAKDYQLEALKEGDGRAYFPIVRTKELIAAIRGVTDLKITVGGFGFSLLAEELMRYLRPDFGVFGGPDGFFEHLDEIRQGEFAQVSNLLYFLEGELIANPRRFYPPFSGAEYTSRAIKEMMAFYDDFPTPGFQGAPVEIMRGCCHTCVFCAEPHVEGACVQYRDLSAVMADIEILADQGVTRLYMISSELNPEGNEFLLELAGRIQAFNDQQPEERRVAWFGANFLLTLKGDDYERLYESGFTGGWFDPTALDDQNARAMRTPYRNESLITHLKTYTQFERRRLGLLPAQQGSHPEAGQPVDDSDGGNQSINWTMFLGNPAATTRTIRDTLRLANQEGLAGQFNCCSIIKNIRVFDYEKLSDAALDVAYSVTPDLERTDYQQLLPSFAYPPALLKHFGSEETVVTMFEHVQETYLSTRYQETRDWNGFVRRNGTAAKIAGWMEELSDLKSVQLPGHLAGFSSGKANAALEDVCLENLPKGEGVSNEDLPQQIVDWLLSACLDTFPDLFAALGLPETMEKLERMTPHELAVVVFTRWNTEGELLDELDRQARSTLSESMLDFVRFCVQVVLYRFSVLIEPKYRALIVSTELQK